MNLLVGDRNQWYPVSSMLLEQNPIARARNRGSLKLTTPTGAGGPIFVRPAVRRLSTDDNPIADFFDRICDEIDRRVQSRRERLQSRFRWWLDFYPCRVIHRALRAKKPQRKQRLPRIDWRRGGARVFAQSNSQIDRWLFGPDGNPAIDRIGLGLCMFALLYVIAQLVRAWGR